MNIRALIVDDEPLGRARIRRFLKDHADIQAMGECGDGESAVEAIRKDAPDLVFLDVQMPEMDGIAVIDAIGVERMPATIFVTAWEQYAIRAFDANALDYLLKPFGKPRFDRALARARERLAGNADREAASRILRAIEDMNGHRSHADRLPVPENGRIVFVRVKDIQWIEAAGNYARLHAAARCHDIRDTLTSLEGKLDPRAFTGPPS